MSSFDFHAFKKYPTKGGMWLHLQMENKRQRASEGEAWSGWAAAVWRVWLQDQQKEQAGDSQGWGPQQDKVTPVWPVFVQDCLST